MTKILIDRATAEQTLEALDSENPDIQLKAALALRTVLGQQQAKPVQEPAACRFCFSEKGCWTWQCYHCGEIDDVQKPATPLPVQETLNEAAIRKRGVTTHCQCEACKNGNIHDSDCSVHNGDALPVGPCDCSLAAPPLPVQEDSCFCHSGVSLQSVSGGAAPEGYLGKVTLLIGGELVDYVKEQPPLPEQRQPLTKDEALTLEALKYAASKGYGRIVREMKIVPFVIKDETPEPPQYSLRAHWTDDKRIGVVACVTRPDGGVHLLQTIIDPPSEQRPWVGLTNDEINNLAAGCHLGNSVQDAIYKAVAKLKDKNT